MPNLPKVTKLSSNRRLDSGFHLSTPFLQRLSIRISVTPSLEKMQCAKTCFCRPSWRAQELQAQDAQNTNGEWVVAADNQNKVPKSREWERVIMLRAEQQETFLHILVTVGTEMLWEQTVQESQRLNTTQVDFLL